MAGDLDETDDEIVRDLLKHFNVKCISELSQLGKAGFEKIENKRIELFGSFAPKITDAAVRNSNMSQAVCEQAALNIATGIKMIGGCFEADTIKVALTGSVANSKYIKAKIEQYLSNTRNKAFVLVEPVLQPELGGIVIAMQEMGILVDEKIIWNLKNNI